MRTKPPYRPTLTGLVLYSDDPYLRYEVLAVSANRTTALMRVHELGNGRWRKTPALASCPVARLDAHADYIEPGPWLAVFPALVPAVASPLIEVQL